MKPLICNLKMEHSLQDILQYKKELEHCVNSFSLVVCPPFCYLPIMHSKYYKIGAQDVSCYRNGSFTGKVSAEALKSLDVYVMRSNSKFLSKDVLTEFAGHGDEIHVFPLSFSEFYSFINGNLDYAFDEYMIYGGLPANI